MAIVTIQTSALSGAQKKRVGERVIDSLHREGVPASSTVVFFRPEDADVFLDGGLLFEAPVARPAPAPALTPPTKITHTFNKEPAVPKVIAPTYPEVKEKVRAMLMEHGALSSFQAQSGLAMKNYDGVSAMLRRIFSELETEGIVEKQGQKRGTRYVLREKTVKHVGMIS